MPFDGVSGQKVTPDKNKRVFSARHNQYHPRGTVLTKIRGHGYTSLFDSFLHGKRQQAAEK